MDKIIIKEGAKPRSDAQRRLNPIVIKLVKKEILEWLETGIIYLISYNEWMRHIQCMPKRGYESDSQ